ncbi:hypothetical protein [Bifidobacterium eulemuris]|uniref:Uncharacterized protein n=1 Tax=Bifidobacterium eulemuris TaxID=1765219 RepID=A0A261GAL9_9BIFI|nr:hypothetical protein [Bifidobacterium eulemuris]OZG68225.1 hypothetical protein BEUL_1238 [Bifidobacterium eulemuris]QOL31718.1 hypothetical protein BE0216_04000 [Bifidobacterium eulemuris]
MRIRTIRPEFYESESMGNVSWDARFVFECLWSYVQDNGVNRDNARLIRGACMPYDGNEALPRIEAALDELERVGCIVRYEYAGKRLLWIPTFREYQKISNPSACPLKSPPELGIEPSRFCEERADTVSSSQTLTDPDTNPYSENGGISTTVSSSQTLTDPDTNPSSSSKGSSSDSGSGNNPSYARARDVIPRDPDFEKFWAVYPNHDYEDAARREFHKVIHRTEDRPSIAALIAGAQLAAQLDNPPQARWWLHDGGWKNKPKPARKPTGGGYVPKAQRAQAEWDEDRRIREQLVQQEQQQLQNQIGGGFDALTG